MQQEGSTGTISLSQYWQAIRRRRRSMFLVFLITWAVACALAWLLPARYRSDATILMEKPKVPKQYVLPNIESDPQEQLEKLTQEILSRTRLQRIIDDFHLYSGGIAALAMGGPVEKMRKDIQIEQVLTQSKPPQLAGFTVTYSGYDPQLVQNVTARLASLFVEENLRTRENQSESTTAFLDRQLQEAKTDLDEQTTRMKKFKAEFVGQLPGELQSNLQVMSGLQVRLQQASESLNRSEQQKLYLSSMLSAYRDSPFLATAGAAGSPVDIDSQLMRLKAELAELQSRYTDKHPAILQLRDQIAKAEKLKIELQAGKGSDDSGLPVSRGVAEIKSQLKGAELDIQNRKKEMVSIASEMQAYQKRLEDTPLREQQLAELTQEYNQARDTYQDLLGKKNDSALATDMERAQQGAQFTLLDPPGWPSSPYFPNRLLTTLGGLVAGLMAALGFAFIRESLDDHIHADVEVSEIAKAPILVAIPPLVTANDASKMRRRTVSEFVCATLVLVMATVSAVVAYVYG
jgi:polysaccharide chain length determinant protein (PEP-CTERM system associated)